MPCSQMSRRYELKRRAERMAATRRRIVEAAVELHTTLGPARTSLAAVAARAGVQRHTLYAHFPERSALYAACSAHWGAQHPFPDPAEWRGLEDALDAVYRWYEETEGDLVLFRRDMELDDDVRRLQESEGERLRELTRRLARGRGRLGRAAVGHALRFETWRSLRREQRLSHRDAVRAMLAFVASV